MLSFLSFNLLTDNYIKISKFVAISRKAMAYKDLKAG
jgi:hypothetical protein